jgi:hypothetical protein
MPSKNKEILKKHRDAWYKKNKKKQITNQLEKRQELKKWFQEYKRSLSCKECGFSFELFPECCDFHHRDGDTKKDVVSRLLPMGIKALKKEIEKCDPLCANCHRKLHAKLEYTG